MNTKMQIDLDLDSSNLEGVDKHMLDENVELTHSDCKELLSKAESYWANPHRIYTEMYQFAHGKQWDPEIEEQRRRAHRDCKTYNVVPGFIRPLVNAVRQAPPSINVYPVSQDTNKQSARTLSGIIRHIEYTSNAQRAYTHALEQVAEGGLGAWRVTPKTKKIKTTQYVTVPMQTQLGVQMVPSKQVAIVDKIEIAIEQIDDPTTVYFDPAAKLPDFSDANWVLYKNTLSELDYKRDYPEGKASAVDSSVVVYEYWYFNSKGTVDFVVFDEFDILVHDELDLLVLPFVVIAGDKVEIDGELTFASLTGEIKAPQQEINWLKSEAIATVSQAPKSGWIADKDAIDAADEDAWANSATDPDVILRKKKGSEVIPIVPPGPPTGYMDLSSQNVEMARQITGIYPDPSTQQALSNASGKAIAYQQAGSQIQTYHFVDALNYGIKRTGEILLDMISVYYNDDDIRISMGVDNTFQHVSIGPTQVPNVQNVDLTYSNFGVVISSGPTYSTEKEKFSEQLMTFGKGNPQMLPLIADVVIRNSNLPGSEELADRFRLMLPEQVQQLIAQQQGNDDPEEFARQAMMQMQQQSAQMQQMQQHLQMLAEELEQEKSGNQVKVAEMQNKKDINDDNIKAKMAMQEADHQQQDQLAALNATMQLILAKLDGHQKGEIENIKSMNKVSEQLENGLKQ
jgi:hypothetical protein